MLHCVQICVRILALSPETEAAIARTTGSMEPYADLNTKQAIDSGKTPGPKLELTAPYLNGKGSIYSQMHKLSGAEEARAFVRYWHSVGFTSMKAYAQITPAELSAAIEESHKLGMKITGHLCSVSFREAAAMGIDDLEHGPFGAPDSEMAGNETAARVDVRRCARWMQTWMRMFRLMGRKRRR